MSNTDKLPPVPFSHFQTCSNNSKKVKSSSLVVDLTNNKSNSNNNIKGSDASNKQNRFANNHHPLGRLKSDPTRINHSSSFTSNELTNNAITITLKPTRLCKEFKASSADSSPVCTSLTRFPFGGELDNSEDLDLWFSATNSLSSLHDCHDRTPPLAPLSARSQLEIAIIDKARRKQRIVPIRLRLDNNDKSIEIANHSSNNKNSSSISSKNTLDCTSYDKEIEQLDKNQKEKESCLYSFAEGDNKYPNTSIDSCEEDQLITGLLSKSSSNFFDNSIEKQSQLTIRQNQRIRDQSQDSESDPYLTDCSDDSTSLQGHKQTISTKKSCKKTIITKHRGNLSQISNRVTKDIGETNQQHNPVTCESLIIFKSPTRQPIVEDCDQQSVTNENDLHTLPVVSNHLSDSIDVVLTQKQHLQTITDPQTNHSIVNNTCTNNYETCQSFSNSISSQSHQTQQQRKQENAMISLNTTNTRRNQSISNSTSSQLEMDEIHRSSLASNATLATTLSPDMADSEYGTISASASHVSSMRRLSTSSTASTSSTTSTARLLNQYQHQQQQQQKFKSSATFMLGSHNQTSSSSLSSTASLARFNNQQPQHVIVSRSNHHQQQQRQQQSMFLDPDTIISPDVRSLVKEIGMDFQELEQASNQQALRQSSTNLSLHHQQQMNGLSILFRNRPLMNNRLSIMPSRTVPIRTTNQQSLSNGQTKHVDNYNIDDVSSSPIISSMDSPSPDLDGYLTNTRSLLHRKSTAGGQERRISLEIHEIDTDNKDNNSSDAGYTRKHSRMAKINQLQSQLENSENNKSKLLLESHVAPHLIKVSGDSNIIDIDPLAKVNSTQDEYSNKGINVHHESSIDLDREVDGKVDDNMLDNVVKEAIKDKDDIDSKDELPTTNQEKENKQQQIDKAVMFKSMSRIEQKMCDLCKKLKFCQDTKEAIDLLNIMINMIEKAWSVHSCGYDLGFKLCNTLREVGGLDILLNCINDYGDQSLMDSDQLHWTSLLLNGGDEKITNPSQLQSDHQQDNSNNDAPTQCSSFKTINEASTDDIVAGEKKVFISLTAKATSIAERNEPITEIDCSRAVDHIDTNSKIDSKSSSSDSNASTTTVVDGGGSNPLSTTASKSTIESLHHKKQVNRLQLKLQTSSVTNESLSLDSNSGSDLVRTSPHLNQPSSSDICNQATLTSPLSQTDTMKKSTSSNSSVTINDSEQRRENDSNEAISLQEHVVYLSARLLSQCLTSENRHYIVANGLQIVIKLACNFTTMKSTQSHRCLHRSTSVLAKQHNKQCQPMKQHQLSQLNTNNYDMTVKGSEMHAKIGTEILEHLFKHSEDACSEIISLGGLQAVLYGCRSQEIDTLRHCASALANLAMYGGADSQQTMIEQNTHVWLFRLAAIKDDNIKYYACLAIVVLVANPEIEADVIKSETLDHVEPFVNSHEPQKFATSTTSHIHGQSANWLSKLIPVLDSKREEARNLAAFHFNMEAYIKKAQGQTEVFKKIGSIEALKKVASSPIAIASKFACQTLRLIGEEVPHKLSQQVPLWTVDDVLEWVKQIGFERYNQAFIDSNVDGDILLQLDEQMLKIDLKLNNGIIRRRFLRELNALKRIADYSSCDASNLYGILSNIGQEYTQYIYNMVQNGVTRDNLHLLSDDQLLNECKIYNSIHRMKIAQTIKAKNLTNSEGNQGEDGDDPLNKKTLDVFVSYRRSTGSQLASLLKVHLQLRGFSVFIDVERLEAGKFDNNLLESIKIARNFILVLSPNALDRCLGDDDCKDWVHKEIVAALTNDCNIIPIFDNFQWPEAESLPQDMRSINYFNGVRWIHDYQDACVDKVERFIRGEIVSYQSNMSSGRTGSVYSSSILTPTCSGSLSSSVATNTRFDQMDHPLSVNNLSASPTFLNAANNSNYYRQR